MSVLASFNPNPDAPVAVDHMIPSQGFISMSGNWARQLLDNELDVGVMRPYVGTDGRAYITRNFMGLDKDRRPAMMQKAVPITNDNATLRFLDWLQLDEAVIKAAKPRLRVAGDIQAAGLVYNLPNGIAKTVLQFQKQSDISGATVSMDGLRSSESDRPVFSTVTFPLPIIHKDFQFPLRQVLESRTGYSPLDTTTAQLAGRRVAEQVEQLTLGVTSTDLLGVSTFNYAASDIFGMFNFGDRIAYSLTLPTTAGWTPDQTVQDVLAMKKASQTHRHYGPWMLYGGLFWDTYFDNDYKPTYNSQTLRQRIMEIDGVIEARTADYIPSSSLGLLQMTEDVVRMVIGMPITTVQWESHGGLQLNFKVMCVMVPQFRSDFYANTGLVHGS